jgi:RimJ/RimL family protein N-acetyltransferase
MSADHDVQLSNETLLLRAFRADDVDAIFDAVIESKPQLGQWLSWCHPNYSIQDTIEFLSKREEAFRNEGEHGFAVIERATNRLVGACGINQIEKAALRANLGYWMRTTATRRGYAVQATLLVARWALTSFGLERIEIVAAVGNEYSQRVAIKAGATREGIARRRLRVHDVQHDAVVFSLVRGDVE